MYHKTNCATSLGVLKNLKNAGVEVDQILYMQKVPSAFALKSVIKKLGGVENIIRKKEPVYKEMYEGKEFSEDEWIDILRSNPILIDRPILIKGNRAILAKSTERIEKFLRIKFS